ncbi:MAG: hypothetical protein AAGA84_12075 [Pseudomonadota bacterium]
MAMIEAIAVSRTSPLGRYATGDNYTDCFSVRIEARVSLEQFLAAFYGSRLFALERRFLANALGHRSTQADIDALAEGSTDKFAAWQVEFRGDDNILLCDVSGRTRSWLKCQPDRRSATPATALMFGSAVLRREGHSFKARLSRALIRLTIPLHRLYARALLRAAKNGLNELTKRET